MRSKIATSFAGGIPWREFQRQLEALVRGKGRSSGRLVPAGFTREVYDRVPDEQDPNGSRLVNLSPEAGGLPAIVEFLGRPFEEAKLFEIASGYEKIKPHRRPPAGFGRLPREP